MPNSGDGVFIKSPKELASELRHSISEYLNRSESRSIKREIELKDKIVSVAVEASALLELAIVPGPQLKFWAEEYEEARLDLLRKHKVEKDQPTDAHKDSEKKALDRFATATKMLAMHAASALTNTP